MKKILVMNKEFFADHSGATGKKNSVVAYQIFPSPFGLLQKWCSAALKPLKIAPLFPAGFALHNTISATQRFHAVSINRTFRRVL